MSTCSERIAGENVWNRIQKSSPLKFPSKFKPSSSIKAKASPTLSSKVSSFPRSDSRASPCSTGTSPSPLPVQDPSLLKLVTVEFCDVSTVGLAMVLYYAMVLCYNYVSDIM
ncbi:hypothetical protein E2C01_091198 [Portunus trituberculatus]|uniref:Uncharacterized protein n=1 Tax=Portunus trituberculatus TaxID=210409 RepID=A0A5B7JSC9_PORTR|nr:hypothetical protein [Portunus trituberculatus]